MRVLGEGEEDVGDDEGAPSRKMVVKWEMTS
jgi:hypothetical protein